MPRKLRFLCQQPVDRMRSADCIICVLCCIPKLHGAYVSSLLAALSLLTAFQYPCISHMPRKLRFLCQQPVDRMRSADCNICVLCCIPKLHGAYVNSLLTALSLLTAFQYPCISHMQSTFFCVNSLLTKCVLQITNAWHLSMLKHSIRSAITIARFAMQKHRQNPEASGCFLPIAFTKLSSHAAVKPTTALQTF